MCWRRRRRRWVWELGVGVAVMVVMEAMVVMGQAQVAWFIEVVWRVNACGCVTDDGR